MGQVLPSFVQNGMGLSVEQRESIAKLQAKVDADLKEILTEEQLAAMRRGPEQRPHADEGRQHRRGDRAKGSERPGRPNRPEHADRPERAGPPEHADRPEN
jgi:hypothetical protein